MTAPAAPPEGPAAAPRPDLSVLLVTYNSAAFIADCIQAVEATVRSHTYEILLADNASVDGSAELVARRFPHVTVIALEANEGFSRANNRCMAAATGRHVVLLNGDAFVQPGALDSLVAFLDATPAAGVAAPKLLNPDGTDQGTARSFPTPAAALFGRRSPLTRIFPGNRWSQRYLAVKRHTGDRPFLIDWVSGACLMVPRKVLESVGTLDEGFFMYWEDADWCHRISDAGFHVFTVPHAQVVHAEGSSRRGWPARQVWTFHRSAYRYYAKHHATGVRRAVRPIVAGALYARALLVIGSNSLSRARTAPRRPAPPATPLTVTPLTVTPQGPSQVP